MTKAALKQAARGLLPDAIIDCPQKGFAIPLARWLNGPLRERMGEVLDHGSIWHAGLLNRGTLRRWQIEHQMGTAGVGWGTNRSHRGRDGKHDVPRKARSGLGKKCADRVRN